MISVPKSHWNLAGFGATPHSHDSLHNGGESCGQTSLHTYSINHRPSEQEAQMPIPFLTSMLILGFPQPRRKSHLLSSNHLPHHPAIVHHKGLILQSSLSPGSRSSCLIKGLDCNTRNHLIPWQGSIPKFLAQPPKILPNDAKYIAHTK